MTRLATLEDFFAHRGSDPLVAQSHEAVMRATLALDYASEVVRGYTRRTFDAISHSVEVEGSGTQKLMLPDPPITEVFTVYERNHWSDEDTLVDPGDYRLLSGAGILQRVDGGMWWHWANYAYGTVTYLVEMVHGFVLPDDDLDSGDGGMLPPDIQGVVLSVASRRYELGEDGVSTTTGEGRTAIQIGTYREEFGGQGSTTITSTRNTASLEPDEAGVLDRYRLPRIG